MEQLRCLNPQCGGYRVDDEAVRLKLQPTNIPAHPALAALVGWWLVAIFAWTVTGAIGNSLPPETGACKTDFWACSQKEIVTSFIGLAFMGIGLLAFCWGIVSAMRRAAQVSKVSKVVILHQYRCRLCGYRWEWRDDQPKPQPPATYTPSALIQRGAERLERMDQDAAAWIYMEQQRRNRDG